MGLTKVWISLQIPATGNSNFNLYSWFSAYADSALWFRSKGLMKCTHLPRRTKALGYIVSIILFEFKQLLRKSLSPVEQFEEARIDRMALI